MSLTGAPHKSLINEEMIEKFKEILKANGIQDEVSEVVMKDAGLKGEGFLSQTYLVTIKFLKSSLKPLNLFVKTRTDNSAHTEVLEELKAFEKESTFFVQYIPLVRELCRSKGQEDLLELYPKCYYGDSRMIVLENLVLDKGYELLDKAEQQDFEAASLALTALAKHHALADACMKEMGGCDEFFKRFSHLKFNVFSTAAFKSMFSSMVESAIETNVQILQKSQVHGKEEAIELLNAKTGKVWKLILDAIEINEKKDELNFLNHGDFWNNNIMFLRDRDTNKLTKSVLIDMQTVRYSSPALDLSYFMFSSVKPEVRRQHLKDLLSIYLETLNSTSEKLGHPTKISYEELFQAYRKRLNFGFWFFGTSTVTTACFAVLKDFDVSEVSKDDWGSAFSRLIQKWIEANPEESLQDANKIVELMMEYKALMSMSS